MTWGKIDDAILSNDKFIALEGLRNYADCITVWFRSFAMCLRDKTGGEVSARKLVRETPMGAKRSRPAIRALASVGLFEVKDDTICLHDFGLYNDDKETIARKKEAAAQRQRAKRAREKAECWGESSIESADQSADSFLQNIVKSVTYEKCHAPSRSRIDLDQSDHMPEVAKPNAVQTEHKADVVELIDPLKTPAHFNAFAVAKKWPTLPEEKLAAKLVRIGDVTAAEWRDVVAETEKKNPDWPLSYALSILIDRRKRGTKPATPSKAATAPNRPGSPRETPQEAATRQDAERAALRQDVEDDPNWREHVEEFYRKLG